MAKKIKINSLFIAERQVLKREEEIEKFKSFYKQYLTSINRENSLRVIKYALNKYKENIDDIVAFSSDYSKIEAEIDARISEHFNKGYCELYFNEPSIPQKSGNSFTQELYYAYLEITERTKRKWQHRIVLLEYTEKCILLWGQHEYIEKREEKNKRFNLILSHNHKSQSTQYNYLYLLSEEEFHKRFTNLYKVRKAILLNGKLIPFEDIDRVKITTTLLNDDEIELLAIKHNLRDETEPLKTLKLINFFKDETDTYQVYPDEETNVIATNTGPRGEFMQVLKEKGGIVSIKSIVCSEDNVRTFIAIKDKINNDLKKTIFKFPERIDISVDDEIIQKGSKDVWIVDETEDHITSEDYVCFIVYVQKK